MTGTRRNRDMPQPDTTRILIIEDDPGTTALQRRALERAGYEVVSVDSPEQAMEAIRKGPVHLVLLDNRLPGQMTGIDLLATLRAAAPELPVIMVTGSEAEGTVMRALRGGARDFIRKEVDYLDHLPQAVGNVLQSAALEAQLQGNWRAAVLTLLLVRANSAAPEAERKALEASGFRVLTAEDRGEAMHVLGQEEVHLLVIDAGDGGPGGVEMYRYLRGAGHEVRAVLVSSGADEEILIDAMRAGFIDFVTRNGDYPRSVGQAAHRAAERLRLEARLAESRTLLAGIVNSAMDAILLVDEERCVRMFNPAAERIFQVPASDVAGRGIVQFIPALAERLATPNATEGPPSHIEVRGIRHGKPGEDDSDLELEVALAPMQAGGRRFLTVIARDVTQRKELERRLLQKDKLESLGLLAGGIAHDFNNLLVGIMGNSSLALETISSNNPARPVLKDVMMASETAANLTRQLLAYAGKGRFVIEPVDLSDLVRQISTLVQTSIPRSVQLRLELMDPLPCVEADATQMQQVIMNLVMNAAEAIGDQQGTVLITTGVQHMDEDYIAAVLVPAQLSPGEYVCVQVHDTGCGMTQETIDRIFDPFFTTKFTGRGLGLAAVLGIVRGHKGAIKVYSTLGQGTTFKLLFPATEQQAPAPTHPPHPPATRGETVLVVDDEEIVRRSAKAMLERHGYSVVLAENGREAVDLFRILADKIDLVLLDMTMPVMGGEEAFRELKTIRPDVRVILSSGYNEVEAVRRFAGKGLAGFLQKPYSALTLTENVRAVLSEWRGTAQS
jgi:PAS domain S-box-containing protein